MNTPRATLLASLALLASCDGCGDGPHLAKLVSHAGAAERDFASNIDKWTVAEDGAAFDDGDGLRTAVDGMALVHVEGAGKVKLGGDTLVRFFAHGAPQDGAPRVAGIEIKTGTALIEAVEAEMPLRTSMGLAIIRRGSNVRVRQAERGMTYEVELGSAVFTGVDGEQVAVEQGQTIEVGIGLAEITDGIPEPEAASEAESKSGFEPDLSFVVQAQVRGVVRSRESEDQEWRKLEQGLNRIAAGSELRLARGSEVDLIRGDERATLTQGSYQLGGPGEALLRAGDGMVMLVAEGTDVRLRVPGGVIIARGGKGGSRAEVRVHGKEGRTELRVVSGQVATEGSVGEHVLAAGEKVTLQQGGGVQGDEEVDSNWKPGLATADLVARAGATFRIYDPSPPSAVGFKTPDSCEHGAQLAIDGAGYRAAGAGGPITVALPAGLHRYRVFCLAEDGRMKRRVVRRGLVRVLKSSGTRKLSTNAPKNNIDTDGRRYTLMYQGRLPQVTIRWPRAPGAPGYVLFLRGPDGKTRKFKSRGPRVQLPDDALRNGKHTAYFTALKSGGKRSKETTFHVTFDNAAPTASIAQPPASGYSPGQVKVAGLALAGTEISVAGQKIALDAKQRFSATVSVPADQRALAIRFKHSKHGVRYYLRRSAGAE